MGKLIEVDWRGPPSINDAINSFLVEQPNTVYLSPSGHTLCLAIRGQGLVMVNGHFHDMTEDQIAELVDHIRRELDA